MTAQCECAADKVIVPPLPGSLENNPRPEQREMPEHLPTRLEREAWLKELSEPVKDKLGRTNVASKAQGAVANGSSEYTLAAGKKFGASGAIDGDRAGRNWGTAEGGGWSDGDRHVFPDWLHVNFKGSKTIDKINIFTIQDNWANPIEPTPTMTFSWFGLISFNVQYWGPVSSGTGMDWINVPGGVVTGNDKVMREFSFPPITADKIRVLVFAGGGGLSRIAEIEAFSVPNTLGVLGVRPNTPIHSVAFQDYTTSSCNSAGLSTDIGVAMKEITKKRIKTRCETFGDCRPGIINLSFNTSATANGGTFEDAVNAVIASESSGGTIVYPGAIVIHSAGNLFQPASAVGLTPRTGYFNIGGIDANGQPVVPLNSILSGTNPNGAGFWNLDDFGVPPGPAALGPGSPLQLGSNYGSGVTAWAPSKLVRSTVGSNNPASPSTVTSSAIGLGSGTSFSAPYVAGLAAKLRGSMSANGTVTQLDSMLRAKRFSNAATDTTGLNLSVISNTLNSHRARPTAEFSSTRQTGPSGANPSTNTAVLNITTADTFTLSHDAYGVAKDANGQMRCDYNGYWNGSYWAETAIPNGLAKRNFGPWYLAAPGTFLFQSVCRDPLDPTITNTASATVNVIQAPTAPTIIWKVNQSVVSENTPYVVQITNGATLGFFTLEVVAQNSSSCSLKAYMNGYNQWLPLVNSQFDSPWYGPVDIYAYGYNWGQVGLYPNFYTWIATCTNGSGQSASRRVHVTVQ